MRRIKMADGSLVYIKKDAALPAGAVEQAEEVTGDELDAKIDKALDKALAPVKELLNKKVTNNVGEMPGTIETDAKRAPITGKDAADGTGLHVVRMLRCNYLAQTNPGHKMVEYAKQLGYEAVVKALSQDSTGSGGVLVPEQFVAELIPFLRKSNIFRRAGVREIPFVGSMELPRQTSAGTASWGAEAAVITPSALGTGSIKLQEKELKALTVVSNTLLQNASIAADEMVRDDLVQTIGEAEESSWLRGNGTESAPKGLRYRTDATNNIFHQTAVSAIAPTLAEVKKERAKLRRKLKDAKIPMVNLGYIMAPLTEEYLLGLTESTGATAFPEIDDEKWGRLPNYVSQHVPTNISGGSGRSELYLVDFAQCIIGRSGGLEVMVFPNGSYEESGAAKSGIARNQTVIRAITKEDFVMRYELSASIVDDLAWGQTS